jgi:hypothetical protein
MHFPLKTRLPLASLLLALAACNLVLVAAREPSTPSTTSPRADGTFHVDVKGTLSYLASDELEGRGVGTRGLDKAADFIADNFRKLGLKPPPGQKDYFQSFKMTTAVKPAEATALRLVPKKQEAPAPYTLGEDYVPLSFSAEKAFEGPIVFVGYSINDAGHQYNDFEGVDVNGKVALALRYEPHDGKGNSRFSDDKDQWSRAATLGEKAKAAATAGATALVLVNPPTFHEEEDPLVPFSRTFGGEHAKIPVVQVRRKVADAWLKQAGSKENLKALQERIDDVGEPHSVVLPESVKVAGSIEIERVQRDVKNVVAVLSGSGQLRDEYIVIGAHYDHLGRGGSGSLAPQSHEIHNGADDNASGTSAMLALAEVFAKRGSFGRSILFCAFTGEESGLIGSQHLVSHPPVDLDKMAFMLNLDMVGRVRYDTIYIGGGGTAPSFEKILADADAASPLVVKSFGKGGMGPSDHMSFALKRVPVLFFYSGQHADYHRPTDDADKINYTGIAAVVDLAANVAQKLLVLPREQYVEAADAHSMFAGPGGPGGAAAFRASLGVVPDYAAEDVRGCRITGTSPGSPAQKAGLKEGDVLVQWGQNKMDSVYDLTDELKKAKPGQTVRIGVLRDGKRIDIDATLAEPRR